MARPGWDPFGARDRIASLWWTPSVPAVTSPALAAYRTLLMTLRRLIVGRRVTVQLDERDLTLRVTEFDFEVDLRGLAIGQLGDVHIAAGDISWGDYRFDEATAVLRDAHFRPSTQSQLAAAPVELSLKLPSAMLQDLVRQAMPWLIAEVGTDGVARLQWAQRPSWGHLELDVRAVGAALWLKPRTLVIGRRRWALPERVPVYPIALPDLPSGLLITRVTVAPGAVMLYGLLPQWETDLPLKRLEEIVTALSSRSGVINLARRASRI
jgi:hypothetical protein